MPSASFGFYHQDALDSFSLVDRPSRPEHDGALPQHRDPRDQAHDESQRRQLLAELVGEGRPGFGRVCSHPHVGKIALEARCRGRSCRAGRTGIHAYPENIA